jgi:biopolymer transport protein ExbB/TolQ
VSTPAATVDNPGGAPPTRRATGISGRELLFNLTLLLIAAILVQAVYATVIRPRAEAIIAEVSNSQSSNRANLRSAYVILHEYEPETVVILTLWSLALIVQQGVAAARNRSLLEKSYIDVDESHVILPEDTRAPGRPLERLSHEEQEMLLPRVISAALNRFGATRSIQDTAEAINDECEYEASRLDAQLSMVKFTAWAIPAIGFVGTVRGIGRALQDAQSALHGDISGVTLGLGVAFNSTLVALILSILVMFCLHQLQQVQDRLILSTRNYVTRRVLRHMRVLA